MIKKFLYSILILIIASTLASCGRNLAANTYTSDSTLNIVLEGKLLTKREIVIVENDRLGDNTTGVLAGSVAGGAVAASGSNNLALIVGGAIVGGVTGAAMQSALGTSNGIEYIVQVNRSNLRDDYYEGSRLLKNAIAAVRATGIITIVQAKEDKNNPVINEGQNVLVILSEKRTRLIPAKY